MIRTAAIFLAIFGQKLVLKRIEPGAVTTPTAPNSLTIKNVT